MRSLALTAVVALLLVTPMGYVCGIGQETDPRGEYRERPYEGFGAGTIGGEGGELYQVTSLADDGPGISEDVNAKVFEV